MKNWILSIVFLVLLIPVAAQAGVKSWMERELQLMAKHGVAHYQGVPKGHWAVGVGTGRKTCMFPGKCKAELHKRLRGSDGVFRVYSVRVW